MSQWLAEKLKYKVSRLTALYLLAVSVTLVPKSKEMKKKKTIVNWISHECLPLRLFCLLGECFASLFPVRKMSEHSLTHILAGPTMKLSRLLSNVKVSDIEYLFKCVL